MDATTFITQLPDLVAAVRNEKADDQGRIEALRQLRVQFVELLHTDVLKRKPDVQNNTAGKLVTYLMEQYREFESLLLQTMRRSSDSHIQMEVWHAIMECVRADNVGHFSHHFFCQAVLAFLTSKRTTVDAVELFVGRYAENWDVRFFWLQQVEKMSRAVADDGLQEGWQDRCPAHLLYSALSSLAVPVSERSQSWCGGLESGVLAMAPMRREGTKARRKRKRAETTASSAHMPTSERALWASYEAQITAYSDAWLAFLRLPIPDTLFKGLLSILTTTVISTLKNPVALSDFLTKATDQGGLVGILALQGLFILVTQHGFEHPDFYRRLYALLTPQVFTARYRVKFLQLVDIFLASSMVPAYSAAAFAKKFARLSVTAPPVGALSCLAFVHNLVRRHPSCMCLIHRPGGMATDFTDPYDPEAEDMDDSKGIESCVWELSASRVHLDPTVAAFAQRFDLDITNRKKVPEVDMKTIVTARYKTQLYEALDKKMRTAPAVLRTEVRGTDALQLDDLIGCCA